MLHHSLFPDAIRVISDLHIRHVTLGNADKDLPNTTVLGFIPPRPDVCNSNKNYKQKNKTHPNLLNLIVISRVGLPGASRTDLSSKTQAKSS